MLRWLSQITALTAFNLKTVPQRLGSVTASLVGMAGVVGVLIGVLSIDQGFRRTLATTGAPDVAFVLRAGSDGEMTSLLVRDEVQLIADAPGIARGAAGALVSPELFVVISLPKRTAGTDANVPMRGVTPPALGVHDKVKIVAGRMLAWGQNEVIVGRAAQGQFRGLDVGSTLQVGQNVWQVVGAFTAEGTLPESEIWADAAVLQSAYRRGTTYQSVKVKLASAGSFVALKDALTSNPRLDVKVQRETEFFAGQSEALTGLVTSLGWILGGLMGLGAILGALNTMYTAVAARTREIGTLRALGFPGSPVVVSVILESLVVAAIGGTVGALLAWLAFDGYQTATMNWKSFSQVAFAFRVTPPLLVLGIVYALILGAIGGLLPALRAARLPVASALRE
ncbi:MAG TPA: FtsX-like permease family protein [Thermoanaerobaculia bacterium]|nr:FtsX-like permease family protein [Thermoanaerobaculia bacterium]